MDRSHLFDLTEQNGKSPWNPSRKATTRVPEPHLPAPTICRYDGASVEIRHHEEVYGRVYGEWPWMYVCSECQARCGMHPFTAIPLGTIANDELRKVRTSCKPVFERLWKTRQMTRSGAYAWLAEQLGIDPSECHWGLFEVDVCLRARDLSATFT
jgi:hypothetical protein